MLLRSILEFSSQHAVRRVPRQFTTEIPTFLRKTLSTTPQKNASPNPGFAAVKWCCMSRFFGSLSKTNTICQNETSRMSSNGLPSVSASVRYHSPQLVCAAVLPPFPSRCVTTEGSSVESASQDISASISDVAPRIEFKRLDKTARHIMQIIDKEAVEEVKAHREIPDKAWLYCATESGST